MKKLLLLLTVGLIFLAGCSKNIMSEYPQLKTKDHHYVTKNYSEILTDMENKVPGVYYFGFPKCPWCQVLVPEMENVLSEYDLTAWTVDTSSKEFENNAVLIKRFEDFMKTFPAGVANESGSVPFTIAISKDGVVDAHLGTTPDHDNPRIPLDNNQKEFLTARLEYLFENVK